jgi:C-terminal processing protease CtpA/Prc
MHPEKAPDQAAAAPNLGQTVTLPQFLAAAGQLTLDEQRLIVDQALAMLQDVYVHLPLKRAMHAIDPLQSLRLLQRQLATASAPMSERKFHNQMISIFVSLRDLHTNYILPAYFSEFIAYLPFYLEEYFDSQDSAQCHYVVSKMIAGFTHPQFKPGVIVKYWNGIPMERAVEINADRNAGSNPDARHARGLENMTIRPMSMSLPPDEEWVVIGYEADGKDLEIKIPWQVFRPDSQNGVAPAPSATSAMARAIGMDFLTETVRRTKVSLFAPQVAEKARSLKRAQNYGAAPSDPGAATSTMPDIISFRTVNTPSGTFGYIRIYSFAPSDGQDPEAFVDAFFNEIVRILALLPQNGLILDVRGNGGGIILAGERLLQLFTPKRITPERFDFINSPLTRALVDKYDDLKPWAPSIDQAVATGATYSQGFPLTPEDSANAAGQRYQGPVVLITNALIYSTTDIFSAGFQDHGIGPILGAHGNTGAGGANVWNYSYLQQAMPDSFQPLPQGTSMRVALRRSTRVGPMAGVPLEDLGVVPDEIHRITRNDLFNDNVDLIAHAASLLAKQKIRTLDAALSKRQLSLTTRNLSRVDVYLNSRPAMSLDVKDGSTQIDLPATGAPLRSIRLDGYDRNEFAVTRTLDVTS